MGFGRENKLFLPCGVRLGEVGVCVQSDLVTALMCVCVCVKTNDDDLDGVPADLDEPDLALKVRVALGKLVLLWAV